MKITVARRAYLLQLAQEEIGLNDNDLWELRQQEHVLNDIHGSEPALYSAHCKLLLMCFLQNRTPDLMLMGHLEREKGVVPQNVTPAVAKENGSTAIINCHACGSAAEVVAIRQLRSADEPMTVFCRCPSCQKRWTM